MDNDLQNGGILSLGGFIYQIRVLFFYASELKNDDKVEFETIDDVAINHAEIIDALENCPEAFVGGCGFGKEYKAIQVKRTELTDSKKKSIILNWILAEASHKGLITEFQLVTDSYSESSLFDIDPEQLFTEVISTKKRKSSTLARVKDIYKDKKDDFVKTFKEIEGKFRLFVAPDIDALITEKYRQILHSTAVGDTVYRLRLRQLLERVTHSLTDAIMKGNAFVYTRLDFESDIESVLQDVRDDHVELDYAVFRTGRLLSPTTLLTGTREYRQLHACNLSEKRIEEHIHFKEYYFQNKLRNMSLKRVLTCENIELSAQENFQSTKERLIQEEKDTPINRLNGTKGLPNSYAPKDRIRIGACIYLTGESTPEDLLISWKDEK